MRYVVMCKADDAGDGWELIAATRTLWTAEGAAQYAASIAPSRYPRIVTTAEYLNIIGWKQERDLVLSA